ncbi:MAG: cytochrome P450 [Jatrophihabitans sp.]
MNGVEIAGEPTYAESQGEPGAARCPVEFSAERDAWLVRDREVARAVLSDGTAFSISGYDAFTDELTGINHFLLASPSNHRRLRRAMARMFSRAAVQELSDNTLRPLADEFAARLACRHDFDILADYVRPYCTRAIFAVIGINPAEGSELVAAFRVAHQLMSDNSDGLASNAAGKILWAQLVELCGRSSSHPGSILKRNETLQLALEPLDLACFAMSLVEAAAVKLDRDLTASVVRDVLSAGAVVQRRLVEQASFELAVRESLRLQGFGMLPRRATAGARLLDRSFGAGETLYVVLKDVGTDSQVYNEPETFDPWRPERAGSVTFGVGSHRCVGEAIAIAIGVAACEALFARGCLKVTGGATGSLVTWTS